MTIDDIKKHFGSAFDFHRATGMSHANYYHWADYGYIPINTQIKIQKLTNGVLRADYNHDKPLDD